MKSIIEICWLCIFSIFFGSGCQKKEGSIHEVDSCVILDQQRIMLYQVILKLSKDDQLDDPNRTDADISKMIVELYFPYFVHCKISGKNDSGVFSMVKKAAPNSKGRIRRFTLRNWETIQSNPLAAGYDVNDIKKIKSFDEFDQLINMYEVDLGVDIYSKEAVPTNDQ